MLLFSCVSRFATLWTAALQAPLSMGFSRQEYWSRLPFPFPDDLLNPGIECPSPKSPALQVDSLPLSHWGSLTCGYMVLDIKKKIRVSFQNQKDFILLPIIAAAVVQLLNCV